MIDTHPIYHASVVRQALISLCVLIISMVAFTVYQTWRDRKEPLPPRKVPTSVTLLFIAGYLSLLGVAALRAYERLDESGLSLGSYITVVALAVNAVAIAGMVYYSRDEATRGLAEMRSTDPGILGMFLRLRIFDKALDDKRFAEKHGEKLTHPGRRRRDGMTPAELIEDVKKTIADENIQYWADEGVPKRRNPS